MSMHLVKRCMTSDVVWVEGGKRGGNPGGVNEGPVRNLQKMHSHHLMYKAPNCEGC